MLRRSKKTIAVPVVAARRAAAFRRRMIVLGLKVGAGAAAVGAAGVAVAARRKRGAEAQSGPHVTTAASTVPPVKPMASVPDQPAAKPAEKPAAPDEPSSSGVPLDEDEKASVDEALASSFEKGDEPGYP